MALLSDRFTCSGIIVSAGHSEHRSIFSRGHNVTARRPSSGEDAVHEPVAPNEGTRAFADRTPAAAELKLSFNVVFPLLGGRATWNREHLLPVFVSLIVALLLFMVPIPWLQLKLSGETATPGINEAWQVFSILGIYIAFIINYYINQMSGRARSGWLQALVTVTMFWLLTTPFWDHWYDLFDSVVSGQSSEKSSNPLAVIAGDFVAAGLGEEGFKALPLIGLALVTVAFAFWRRRAGARLRAVLSGVITHFGLREPLDGIVLGAASGSGFFIYETLVQYVPQVIDNSKRNMAFEGLVQLLARGIPELTAHSAYSGLFGYFIGLSVLRPGTAPLLIPLGWLSAAVLHGAWDATSDLTDLGLVGVSVRVVIGLLSYALLAGAIFKAREISPSFARRCFDIRCADLAA